MTSVTWDDFPDSRPVFRKITNLLLSDTLVHILRPSYVAGNLMVGGLFPASESRVLVLGVGVVEHDFGEIDPHDIYFSVVISNWQSNRQEYQKGGQRLGKK